MNRFEKLYNNKSTEILNIYTTIGYPSMTATCDIVRALSDGGVDIIELGIPYSDPLADGPVIQESSRIAIENGFSLHRMFDLLEETREQTQTPIVLMGYLNPLLQYGMASFLKRCKSVGVDALIIPDMPPEIYESTYREQFKKFGIGAIFLITPNTSAKRIQKVDQLSDSFVYMVSSNAITGKKLSVDQQKTAYFERIASMNLTTPQLIGFGIHNPETLQQAFKYANGAIIGSAFIQHIGKNSTMTIQEKVEQFIGQIGQSERLSKMKTIQH